MAIAPLDLVSTVCQLVAIPSVNPMGRAVSGEQYYEYRVTDYLEAFFQRLGLDCERQSLAPRRENILARLDGSGPAAERVVVFEAHQDTVPVEGMTIDPWRPQVREGRIYGRGACDIKGGMASMLHAVARLAAERPAPRPAIVMACSVNEEHGFEGARRMARSWSDGSCRLLDRPPEAVVVAEPTELQVVVAHKGTVRWRLHALGRAAHSSTPQLGDNAVYRMARVLGALEAYAGQLEARPAPHALLGPPTLSVGMIQGGISVNTVPDRCTIEIDRRVLPDESPRAAREEVVGWLRESLGPQASRLEHNEPYIESGGLSDDGNRELADRLASIAAESGGGRLVGVPYGTDAPAFAAERIPTVVFGPGSIAQAHTHDEWVSIEQLRLAAEVLYQFATRR